MPRSRRDYKTCRPSKKEKESKSKKRPWMLTKKISRLQRGLHIQPSKKKMANSYIKERTKRRRRKMIQKRILRRWRSTTRKRRSQSLSQHSLPSRKAIEQKREWRLALVLEKNLKRQSSQHPTSSKLTKKDIMSTCSALLARKSVESSARSAMTTKTRKTWRHSRGMLASPSKL